MNINIKRFIDVDLRHHKTSTFTSLRDTVVLFVDKAGISTSYDSPITSLSDFNTKYSGDDFKDAREYAKIFFNNKGIKLDVRCGITSSELFKTELDKLDVKEIVVCYTGDTSIVVDVARDRNLKNVDSETIADTYGISQKMFMMRIESSNISTDYKDIDNLIVKVSTITGAEMTIAAYLSSIDIYGTDTIKDYMFTEEDITPETSDDTILGNVLDNNMNIDMTLSNVVMNFGGNTTKGNDLVNEYVLIVLQQTITDRVMMILKSKVKGNSGVSSIYTAIASELTRYVTNGYLDTSAIYEDDTMTVTVNEQTYTIIEQNTVLSSGYKLVILPLSSLTTTEKQAHKCPKIFLVIANSYGIRTISIRGDVL